MSDHIGVEPQDAITAVARMLGFGHAGEALQRVVEEQLQAMLKSGTLVLQNGDRLYTRARRNQ